MRALRIVGRVLAVLVVLSIGGVLYMRYVGGAVVNVPATSVLSQVLPWLFPPPRAEVAELASTLRLPPGLRVSLFATDIPDARMLRTTRTGDLVVSSPGRGAVWLLRADRDGDGAADGVRLLLRGLDGPNGLDFHGPYLYIAEEGRVGRIAFDHARGTVSGRYEVVIDGLPAGGNHWKKTIRFGPDGALYVAIGSSCNVCIEEDARRAALMRFAPDGSGGRVFATGLRNSAGFDWRPSDGALFATDNGRDLLGDDFPPCELNRIEEGGFYGWPFVNGDGVRDPDIGAGHDAEAARATSPAHPFRAHNAPLGILFPRAGLLGPAYRDAALVALHGSWNRSRKDGYSVVALRWSADGRVRETPFFTGFLVDDRVHGRPAELAEGTDGAIYVSDDYTGSVYRIDAGKGGGATGSVRVDQGAPARPSAEDTALLEREAAEPALAAPAAAAPPRDAATLRADGERLFAGSGCTQCHIPPGVDPLAAPASATATLPLRGLAERYTLPTLQAYLARPTQPMPPVVAADERLALAHWLLWADAQSQPKDTAAGAP